MAGPNILVVTSNVSTVMVPMTSRLTTVKRNAVSKTVKLKVVMMTETKRKIGTVILLLLLPLLLTEPELEVLNDLVYYREFPRGSIAFGMQKSSKEQLKHALETGYTFFDGADSYKHEGTDTTVLLARVIRKQSK